MSCNCSNTGLELGRIAGKRMKDGDREVRQMAASLLRQVEQKECGRIAGREKLFY